LASYLTDWSSSNDAHVTPQTALEVTLLMLAKRLLQQ